MEKGEKNKCFVTQRMQEKKEPPAIENKLLQKLKELGVGPITTLKEVRAVAHYIASQRFSIDELQDSKLNPYFPTNLDNPEFNGFSRRAINDAQQFIFKHLPELQAAGMLHAWVVGSSAVGLSHAGKYGVLKMRIADSGFYYRRTDISAGDIDISMFVTESKYDEFASRLRSLATNHRLEGSFSTPAGLISFYLTPYEEELHRIEAAIETYGYVTRILWKETNFNLLPDEHNTHSILEQAALKRVLDDTTLRNFFFRNAADRWAHGRHKMLIKLGYYRLIFESASNLPTLFSAAKTIKAKRENGYFEI